MLIVGRERRSSTLSPSTSRLTPHTSHSHLAPHTSHLAPRTSHLAPSTRSNHANQKSQRSVERRSQRRQRQLSWRVGTRGLLQLRLALRERQRLKSRRAARCGGSGVFHNGAGRG